MAPSVDSCDELLENLLWERDNICDEGTHPYKDSQVIGLAQYWWQKRLDGEIWGGKKMLAYDAKLLDLVKIKSGGIEAFTLFNILLNAHGY